MATKETVLARDEDSMVQIGANKATKEVAVRFSVGNNMQAQIECSAEGARELATRLMMAADFAEGN